MTQIPAILPFLFFDGVNWIFHVFFMAFFLIFGSFFWIRDRREKAALEQCAGDMGLLFYHNAPQRLESVLKRFDLLRVGSISCATQVFEGVDRERNFYLFNWYYKSDSSLKAVRGGFSCAILELPHPYPFLNVYPRHLSQFVQCTGMEEHHVENEAFSKSFGVACRTRQFTSVFFHKAMTDFFLANPNLILELAGNSLLLAVQGELTPANAKETLDGLLNLATLLPHPEK